MKPIANVLPDMKKDGKYIHTHDRLNALEKEVELMKAQRKADYIIIKKLLIAVATIPKNKDLSTRIHNLQYKGVDE